MLVGLTASVVAALAAPPATTAQEKVGFPDGEWVGQPLVWKGSVDEAHVFSQARADVTFQLTVQDGKVTDGKMKLKGGGASVVEGPPAVVVNLRVVANYKLGGTATDVTMTGEAFFKGSAETEGFKVPLAFYSGVGESSFSPSFVTCNKATGDLSTRHEEDVRARGVNASIDAAFVAVRVAGDSGAASGVLEEAEALKGLILELPSLPKPADLLAVAEKIDSLNAKLVGLAACDAAPKGYQKGLQDTVLSALFQDLLDQALGSTDQYSAQDLIALLSVGVRVGAVGNSVPGSKAIKDTAKSLHTQLEAALLEKVDQASASGDKQTILDILIAAQQYGMNALADKAQGALGEVKQ
jgi:hypothetical protein